MDKTLRKKIILDLCGGTGSWSKPYLEAGYDVRVITLPEHDVRLFEYPKEKIYGILAAPPCTVFCTMRRCRGKPNDEEFKEGLAVVDACLRIITMCKPVFWALENPEGYLKNWLGKPKLKFHPYHFGDPYTKKTFIWGEFNNIYTEPLFNEKIVQPVSGWVNSGKKLKNGPAHNAKSRSITPAGFAQAFYAANR